MTTLALLLTAFLFGGMTLFSFGFAAMLFKIVPVDEARRLIRASFPWYYLWVIATSAVTALALLVVGLGPALAAALVAGTTLWARQDLMHRINAATDRGDKSAFGRLHGLSVVLQLAQIAAIGWALTAFL